MADDPQKLTYVHVYFDESGDLGFDREKPGASRHFVMVALEVNDPVRFTKHLSRVFHRERDRRGLGPRDELKATHSPVQTRHRILDAMTEHDVRIDALVVSKEGVNRDLRSQPEIAYNYFAAKLMVSRVSFLLQGRGVRIFADSRHREKVHGLMFAHYLKMKIAEEMIQSDPVSPDWTNHLELLVEESHKVVALMVCDFACNAVFRKYERGQLDGYDRLKSKVRREDRFFFQQ